MKTVFLRVLEADDKAAALLEAVRDPEQVRGRQRFEVDHESFSSIPRSPFAYWVTQSVLQCFERFPPFETKNRIARITNPVADNFRFVRAWWEPTYRQGTASPAQGDAWVPLCKGGAFSPFYYDPHLLVSWSFDRNTYLGFVGTEHRPLEKPACLEHFFKPGITWPVRTSGLSFRVMPTGCVFSSKGPAAFDSGTFQSTLSLTGLLNSRAFAGLVSLQLARTELAQSYEVGLIQTTPVPALADSDREALASLAGRAWSLKRSLDTRVETSHAFTLPALLQVAGVDVASRVAAWVQHRRVVEAELITIQAELDDRCFVLYGIDEVDRRAMVEGFDSNATEAESSHDGDEGEDDVSEDVEEVSSAAADMASLAAELVCWAAGVAFGRFDMRLAIGARPMPIEPKPFDPLPTCSAGMLTGADGLPLARPAAGYPIAFPEAGVLVDDLGHTQDLPTLVRAVFDTVFGAEADRWWNDVAALLDPNGHELRGWLAGSFFEHHLKRHSKSRRKAPIVWQLGTPSGRYSVWLYAHRFTRDSFFQLQNEVVGPKLTHEERKLTSLMQNAGGSPSAQERKEMAAQEAVVEELRTMLDEIKRVAPLWNPNLDDGVVLTMAPLWRLVPQHKPWQKELKSKWDELSGGKYDWAHIAMHLWPERVVPKCATDRSLAIAHGVEDVFWVEGADGKWKARSKPVRSVDELVSERGSSAVKVALKSLLDAPTASGNGRARSRRATSSAATEAGSR